MVTTDLKALHQSPLHEAHQRAGAKFAEFAGWSMPVQYQGILQEHEAVRQRAGVFDLSHMGEFLFAGETAARFLSWSVTNDPVRLHRGQAQYACICTPAGGVVDDIVIYRLPDPPATQPLPAWTRPLAAAGIAVPTHQDSEGRWAEGEPVYLVVVNAANRDKDARWWQALALGKISLPLDDTLPGGDFRLGPWPLDVSDQVANVAIQGPKAEQILRSVATISVPWESLRYYWSSWGRVQDVPALVARTGYTGEDGFELYVDSSLVSFVWETLLAAGRPSGLVPAGLGARDTLRTEMRYALYGHELDESTTPLEAGLDWVVKYAKGPFVGRTALVQQKRAGVPRQLVGLVMEDRSIPRAENLVKAGGVVVGRTTSGGFSPSLAKGVALAYVPVAYAPVGTFLSVEIRQQDHPARVAKTPLVTPHIHH
ncbi:MAG: glycine cleavage system protein T [Limnochordaceae bacterium]|nr:glycine cleavage system protein T [Limnochordaceae bacterium]